MNKNVQSETKEKNTNKNFAIKIVSRLNQIGHYCKIIFRISKLMRTTDFINVDISKFVHFHVIPK